MEQVGDYILILFAFIAYCLNHVFNFNIFLKLKSKVKKQNKYFKSIHRTNS